MANEKKKTEGTKYQDSRDREVAQEYPDKSKEKKIDQVLVNKAKELLKGLTASESNQVLGALIQEAQEKKKAGIAHKRKWADAYTHGRVYLVELNGDVRDEKITAEEALAKWKIDTDKTVADALKVETK